MTLSTEQRAEYARLVKGTINHLLATRYVTEAEFPALLTQVEAYVEARLRERWAN